MCSSAANNTAHIQRHFESYIIFLVYGKISTELQNLKMFKVKELYTLMKFIFYTIHLLFLGRLFFIENWQKSIWVSCREGVTFRPIIKCSVHFPVITSPSAKFSRNMFCRFVKEICGHFMWHLPSIIINEISEVSTSLFQSTTIGKRCFSYNAPPTSRKRAPDHW